MFIYSFGFVGDGEFANVSDSIVLLASCRFLGDSEFTIVSESILHT